MREQLVKLVGFVAFAAAIASCARGREPKASRAACGPIPAVRGAALRYGPEGGNLRPFAMEIFADGHVREAGSEAANAPASVTRLIDPKVVQQLVAAARDSGFWELPANPTRSPTSNPDESRIAVLVQSTCGSHSSAYPLSEAPRAFTRLVDELAAATGVKP